MGKNLTANIAADRVGVNPQGLTPAVARWLRGQRIGTVGLAVLAAAAVLAVALGIHGYGNRGLALPAVAASTASPVRSQPAPSPTKGAAVNSTSGSTSSTTSPPTKLGPALSSTQYAGFTYLIYPGPVSTSAQQAMAGYSISTQSSGGNVVVAVSAAGSSQTASKKTYPSTDKIYFVEANLGDDSGATELDPSDDGLVATN
ncbi:MAG TPA: hypothetical protein VKA15_27005, partial [Isosphaeraceae bacterium]|nr:hypothetical protein [Isosphaeraceae bacterium]